ncbi:MAG: YfiR family protein, partial [Limisphaerales bacterium]
MTFFCSGLASAEVSKEYQIKAVLLFNLTRFVDWPDSAFTAPDAPLVIGIVGRDPFGEALDEAVRGEEVNGHKIIIQRFPNGSSVG